MTGNCHGGQHRSIGHHDTGQREGAIAGVVQGCSHTGVDLQEAEQLVRYLYAFTAVGSPSLDDDAVAIGSPQPG